MPQTVSPQNITQDVRPGVGGFSSPVPEASLASTKLSPTIVTDANIRETTIPKIVADANGAVNTGNNNGNGTTGNTGGQSSPTGSQNASDTNTDYSNMSYEDIYNNVLGKMGNNNTQTVSPEISLIDDMMKRSDASTASQLSSIKAAYKDKEDLLKQEQESNTAGLKNLLLTSGAYRTGGASGVLDQKAANDIRDLSSLDNEERAAEGAVLKAQQDQDFQLLGQKLSALKDIRTEKTTLAGKIADNIQTQNKEIRDRQQKVADDINQVALDAAKNGADSKTIMAIKATKNQTDAIAAAGNFLQSGTGTLGDYLEYKRETEAKGLVPKDYQTFKDDQDAKDLKKEVDKAYAVQDAKNRADANSTKSDKVQQKLEQQYRQVLSKEFSSRTGSLGIENGKVNQANHLNSLFTQYYDPKTKQYNIPKAQYAELAMGLANLVSPTGTVTEGAREAIFQRTAAGDLNGAISYITGTPQSGTTNDVVRNLVDSVDRQAETAVRNREAALQDMRDQAPTDLEQSRIDKLNKSTEMVKYEGEDRIAKRSVDDYVKGHPEDAEMVAKLYEVPGAKESDIRDYLRANGKIQ